MSARKELYSFAMEGKEHSPDNSDRMSERIDAFGAEACADILRIVSAWYIEVNDVGGVDAGDLAWRLEQAGYRESDRQ